MCINKSFKKILLIIPFLIFLVLICFKIYFIFNELNSYKFFSVNNLPDACKYKLHEEYRNGYKFGYDCVVDDHNFGNIIPYKYDIAYDFKGDFAVIGLKDYHDNYKFGVIDKTGYTVVPIIYDSISNYDGKNGVACYYLGYNFYCGVIDSGGKFIVSPVYKNFEDAKTSLKE